MNHKEFVAAFKSHQINVNVDAKVGLQIADDFLPGIHKFSIYFWSWAWVVTLFGGVFLALWFQLWAGLFLVFIVTPAIKIGLKYAACRFLVQHSLKSEKFYKMCRQINIFQIQNM